MGDYLELIREENLLQAWAEFRQGKRKRGDVQTFERNLEINLDSLYYQLKNKTYRHGNYYSFYVQDPKQRHIHKAQVPDRVIHHLLYKHLYGIFDSGFIYDSYSCRLNKGTHKGVKRLEKFARIISRNYTKECWVIKFDIKKFFANIDHNILLELLKRKIKDREILWLLSQVINSFHSEFGKNKGIPLGNLTSQVFANIYMNELDQFIKHQLRIKYYLRYADDFVIMADNNEYLGKLINPIGTFLKSQLKLELHPNKIILRKLNWGVDFLGYVTLPHCRLPRTKTKKRVFQKLKLKIGDSNFNQSIQSYLGYLGHANSYKLTQKLKNQIWFWEQE